MRENSDVSASLSAVIAPTWPAPTTAAKGRGSAAAATRSPDPAETPEARARRAGTARRIGPTGGAGMFGAAAPARPASRRAAPRAKDFGAGAARRPSPTLDLDAEFLARSAASGVIMSLRPTVSTPFGPFDVGRGDHAHSRPPYSSSEAMAAFAAAWTSLSVPETNRRPKRPTALHFDQADIRGLFRLVCCKGHIGSRRRFQHEQARPRQQADCPSAIC